GAAVVLELAAGVRKARVLFVAAGLGVFTALAEGEASADELCARLGLHPGAVRDFLHALVALGLLERHAGRYRNSPVADAHLVPGRPGYLGGFLRFLDEVLHPAWDGLAESLRTGQPHNSAARDGNPYSLHHDPAERTSFLDAMDVLNAPAGARLARLDWSGYRSFVDVGGARGTLAVRLVEAHPRLTAAVFDLPEVEADFDRHVASSGLADAIRFVPGDFFTDPLPAADVLIFGHVLHNWPVERRRLLLRKAYEAVAPGGAVLVHDPMLDEANPRPAAALAGLNMLVWSSGGSEYTPDECRRWMADAGFSPITATPLGPAGTLVVGHKR
ncbi:methyltransferase, partial [Actinosynnema sp. NPDC023658]|uniref:methyltransferase n=1 Tax=Actinosynnema sp. NPDC023658 TaxID=3155465 RepID=UPI0033F68E50